MPPSLIHHLTSPGQLTQASVVCGARDAALGTWEHAQVTCPQCRAPKAPRRAHGGLREKAFQEAVRQQALAAGFLYYHVYDSRKSPPGFPDILLVKGSLLLIAELKLPGKHPTAAQQRWLDALGQVTQVLTRVWTPDSWPEIEAVLR